MHFIPTVLMTPIHCTISPCLHYTPLNATHPSHRVYLNNTMSNILAVNFGGTLVHLIESLKYSKNRVRKSGLSHFKSTIV